MSVVVIVLIHQREKLETAVDFETCQQARDTKQQATALLCDTTMGYVHRMTSRFFQCFTNRTYRYFQVDEMKYFCKRAAFAIAFSLLILLFCYFFPLYPQKL